jgi:hypothetical protein
MSLIFKYCPFCGGQIPPNNMVKFCPFCGEKFVLNESTIKGSHSDTPIIVHDTLKAEPLPLLSDERTEINIDKYKRSKMGKIIESECYSIILKNAPDKRGLVKKLEKVLLRGSFAIRLAVDTIPSIIVYKAKSDDIVYLNEVFTAEQASTSVVAGDFNNKPVIEEIFTMFGALQIPIQKIIKQLPINLWLGDQIRGVFSNTYWEEKEGITIVSDKNIYFIPIEIDNLTDQWFIRSYQLLSQIIKADNRLQFTYKDKMVASISFVDIQKLTEAYQCIYDAVEVTSLK